MSYLPSPIKLHDYGAGVMAGFGSVVEYIGGLRGLPSQTMNLNRRACGFHINELQVQFLNGDSVMMDTWPIGADNGTYRTKDGRYVQMIGLFPHLVNPLLGYLRCVNIPEAIQAAVEKKTAQQLEDEVADGLNLALGMVRTPQEWLGHPQGQQRPSRPCSTSTNRAPPKAYARQGQVSAAGRRAGGRPDQHRCRSHRGVCAGRAGRGCHQRPDLAATG